MISLALTLLLSAATGCEDVYDRTADCPALSEQAVTVSDAEQIATAQNDGKEMAWRFFAASGLSFVASAASGSVALWSKNHIERLSNAGNLGGSSLRNLREQERYGVIFATGGLVTTFLLAGTGISFLLFDAEEGAVRMPFRIVE